MIKLAGRVWLIILAAALVVLPAQGQQTKVFTGATIYPISSPVIDNGILVVEGNEIAAVGAEGEVSVPSGAEMHDVSGQVIMPGLVDSHSHIGGVQGGDGSDALHPDVRGLDAIDVRDPSLWRARAGGITTVNVMPGSGLLLSGQTAYMKTRHGNVLEDLLLCDNPNEEICGGIKMANGTNPIGESPTMPSTRARSAAMARERFTQAQHYQQRIENAESEEDMPDRDLQMEALVEVMEGERTVHFHTHRHDDILSAIRIGEEFGFEPVLHHVSEGWKVADEIAEAGLMTSIIALDSPGGKHEAVDLIHKTGGVMEEAGVDVGYHTDDYVTDSRLFRRMAAFGVRAGMSYDGALEALTLAGARMMGLEDRVGSLEEGKDADFVVLSGDPLSTYTHVEQTWIEGGLVFNRDNPEHREYATGGYRVYGGATNHYH